jgi:hypothetical protein
MRKTLRSLALAVVAAAAALTATPAAAELDPGTKAPRFTGKEFVNTTSVDVQTLAGRVVLLEIFRTW